MEIIGVVVPSTLPATESAFHRVDRTRLPALEVALYAVREALLKALEVPIHSVLPVFMSVRTTRRPPESNCMPLVMPLGDRNTVVAPVARS